MPLLSSFAAHFLGLHFLKEFHYSAPYPATTAALPSVRATNLRKSNIAYPFNSSIERESLSQENQR